jgi:hypothetical protein
VHVENLKPFITLRFPGCQRKGYSGLVKPALSMIVLIALAVLACTARLESHDVITTTVTWNREISRLFYERCVSCHQEKGSAFALTTYAQARPWAVAIKEEVLARRMPPWGAVKGFGEFRNDQALTPEQQELVTSWVEGGVPEGDAKDIASDLKTPKPTPAPRTTGAIAAKKDFVVPRTISLDGILPQSVPANQSVQIIAERPDGIVEPLIWLYDYKSTFAHAFVLRSPLSLPAGTIIRGIPEGSTVLLLPRR